ncbi:Protein CBG12764 [Caenorhabditis briggsae]|uniref:Protein CBG12764 n=1 Tax=Caenorhabditis briggsae TaxID=6238 RepID=A8XGI7_CAEBR|nr:Protein CBG12764 [Caenorhabditis briggsae]CAP31693.1 Protein CBG12764 [Caenorhabditis briggsae]
MPPGVSVGDEGMLQIFNIPGVGEGSLQHMVFYPTVEQAKAETAHLEDPYYQQKKMNYQVIYSQPAAESQQYYTQQREEASDYQPEDSSTAQYQEYNPYAKPRTPPQEEEDIGDYVYNTTVPVEQNGASPQPNEYNPEV